MKVIANAPCRKCNIPSNIIKNASKYLKGTALELFKTLMNFANTPKKGRRYSKVKKNFCMGLYFQSPRAYRFMSKIFHLPTTRMIRYWLSDVYMEVGWNNSVFSFLEKKSSTMSTEDKLCGITFDAISIKSGVYYQQSNDKIVGFEDCGQYCQGEKPAQYAMVFMAKGLCRKWKHVLGYFLFSKSISAEILKNMIYDCITKLTSCGFHPKFIVCDQDATNRCAFSKMNISAAKPYIDFQNDKIFCFYDTPHLLKSTRNIFTKYDIQIGNDIARWNHVVHFYESDKIHPIRIAPKLTDSHIDSNSFEKMKVKYATQILSRTVASGLYTYASLGGLPKEATSTATFISNINELFDVFNSSVRNHYRPRKCAIDGNNGNLEFLNAMRTWIESWKIIGTNRKIPSVQGWLLNISSLQSLWEDVSATYKFQYLLTRRINQDCLENFFCCIRKAGGNNYTPNVQQLKNAMKNVVCNGMLSDAYNGNCIDDVTPVLSSINKFDQSINSQHPRNFSEDTECSNSDKISQIESEEMNIVMKKYDNSDIHNFLDSFDYHLESVEDPPPLSPPQDLVTDSESPLSNTSLAPIQKFIRDFDYSTEDPSPLSPERHSSSATMQEFIRDFDYGIEIIEDPTPPSQTKDTKNSSSEYSQIEDNIIYYFTGYCCNYILKNHDCIACKNKLVKNPLDNDNAVPRETFLLKKGDGDSGRYLSHPTDQIFDIVKSYENNFQKHIMSLIHCHGIKKIFYQYISKVCIKNMQLCCEVEAILKNSFLNMRLHYHTKFFNRTLRVKRKYNSTVHAPPPKKCRKLLTVTHT